jgi:hypothetical protein
LFIVPFQAFPVRMNVLLIARISRKRVRRIRQQSLEAVLHVTMCQGRGRPGNLACTQVVQCIQGVSIHCHGSAMAG